MIADRPGRRPVLDSELAFHGLIWDVRRDRVDLGGGGTVLRDCVAHPGAVAVLVLDDEDRVLLQRQYRHPVGAELWEPPAGLLDVAGEDPVAAAARELAEEADLRAGSWWLLTQFWSSPGFTDERLRVYLARDLAPVPEAQRHVREAEEADLEAAWVPLDDAVDAVLAGRVGNPSAVVGILAAAASRARGWAGLECVPTP